MNSQRVKVLLIEDDEDDYILVRDLLTGAFPSTFALEWRDSFDSALAEMDHGYDVYLLDYLLGDRTGLELLQEMIRRGCKGPIIFLTGQGDYQVDMEAMKAGAVDYLVKGQITPPLLERSIRYAIERKKSESALRESERQLRFLSTQLLTVQEAERKRVAAELHDNLGQVLSAIKFGVENSLARMQPGEGASQTLRSLIPTIQEAIEEVRRIYTHLRPTVLDDLGILATLAWFCREFQKIYPHLTVKQHISVKESQIPEFLRIVIYRVLQEAMNNTAQHSRASQVDVELREAEDTIELAVRDNGQGFEGAEILSGENACKGLGLSSMKERVEISGGFLIIDALKGRGTTIRALWPCKHSQKVEGTFQAEGD